MGELAARMAEGQLDPERARQACRDRLVSRGRTPEQAASECADPYEGQRGDDWAEILIRWFDGAVRPMLRAAERDDRLVGCAIEALRDWRAQYQMTPDLGVSARLAEELLRREAEGRDSIWTSLANAFTQSSRRCVANRDLREIPLMIRYAEVSQMLATNSSYAVDLASYLTGAISHCAHFELSLESLTFLVDDKGNKDTSIVEAERFAISPKDFQTYGASTWEGEGVVRYVSFTVEPNVCAVRMEPSDAPVRVVGLSLAHGEATVPCACSSGQTETAQPQLEVLLDPEPLLTKISDSPDPDCPVSVGSQTPHWNWAFEWAYPQVTYVDERNRMWAEALLLDAWQVFAARPDGQIGFMEHSCPGGAGDCPDGPPCPGEASNCYDRYFERSAFRLYHTPKPGAPEPAQAGSGGQQPEADSPLPAGDRQ